MRVGRAAGFSLVLISLLCLGLFATAPRAADTIEGRVVGISDGDTITVLTPGKEQVRVRLAEIDTPESGQPYGTRARQVLSELVFSGPSVSSWPTGTATAG